MRIKADSELGRRVRRVLLDGKPVLEIIELDTTEGWIKVRVPQPPPTAWSAPPDPDTLTSEDKSQVNIGAPDWKFNTLHGKVDVILEEEIDDT